MDFGLDDEQQAIFDLAEQIIGDHSSHERLRRLAASDDRCDRACWEALAAAGVVGACIPFEHGGLGLGFMATAMAVEVVGAHASPVPLLPTAVAAAMPIAEFGTPAQKERWLPGISAGRTVGSACLYEPGAAPAAPATAARIIGGSARGTADCRERFVLDGCKPMVPAGLDADLLLMPAGLGNGETAVFLVSADADGISRERVDVTTGRPMAAVTLAGVEVGGDALLGAGRGAEVVSWIEQRVNAAICMTMAGAAQSAVRLAADYTKQRRQFDRPIATFQAVSNQAGDSYIDTEAMTLTARQAAWRIDAGLPADDQIAIARYWAADAGFRVMHAAVHVHGGVGVDRDYPLHRHFLLARELELTLGNGEEHLAALGRSIAAAGP